MDKFDLTIMQELQQNGRMTITELAQRVGLSKTPCQVRMRRLEETGHIKAYRAILDRKKLAGEHIAFVNVTLSDTKTPALASFNEAVHAISEIEECHMIASSFDYLLKVRTANIETYRTVLGEKISALPFVQHTSTCVVIESVKDYSEPEIT
ncbi:MAG: Lrp/AsnC ligand binding domain-containing protein [Chromatiales bacterium]|jgi:Lrp/AsnC family leucine-responsive transcriptional regulator